MMEQQTLLQELNSLIEYYSKEPIARLIEYASAIELMQNSCSARLLPMK